MPIHVDVIVNAHKRSITNATRSLKSEFDKAAADIGKDVGREIGDRIARGIRSSSAEVNKAMDDATNAAITRRRTKEYFKEIKKLYKAGEVDVETYRRAVEDLGKATRNYDLLVTKLKTTEETYQKTFRERADITKQANAALKDFTASHDGHLTMLEKLRAANIDVINQNNMVAKAFDSAGDSLVKTRREYEKYQQMEREGKATRDQLLRQWQQVEDAWKKEGRAIRDTTAALAKHGTEQERHARRQEEHLRRQREKANNSDLGEVGSWAARNLGALTPLGVVTPTLVLPLGIAFTQVANAAVAASQGIALLPGVVAAAGAGMGTLQMATAGFSDTIKEIASGDMEKFAAAIQNLSPNAQQAALSIQNLWPALKGIQQATQDAFFKNSGAMIFDLTKTYAPAIEQLTTRIAGAFNGVMATLFNDLMDPATQGQLGSMMDNIAAAFERLSPVVKPFVDAFIDLADVGASFLPGMVDDIASMAQNFADFISQARDSGDLANFMNIGWEAIKAVGSAILDLGQTIYDVFGLKSAQDIENFKETMSELNDLLGITLSTLKHFFEDAADLARTFSAAFGPLGDNVNVAGEWLAYLAEAIIGAKFIGMFGRGIGKLGEFATALGGAKTATAALDTAAATAAAEGGGIALLASRAKGALGPISALVAALWAAKEARDNSNWGNGDPVGSMGPQDFDPSKRTTSELLYGPYVGKWLDKLLGTGGSTMNGTPINQSGQGIPGLGDSGRGGGGQGMHTGSSVYAGTAAGRPAPPIPQATPWLSGNWSPSPVPPPPPDKNAKEPHWQSTPGTFELSNIPLGQFPGAQWSVPDPASLYNPPGYDKFKQGKPGYWDVDPMGVQDAAWKLEEKKTQVEEARKAALKLQADNLASEDEKVKALHNVIEQERDLIKAEVDLAEERQGTYRTISENTKDLTKGLDDLTAGLDKDLGFSKGLPGLADNLARFIGALAAAPLLGPLNAMTEALGGKDATGVGLSGMLAAQGAFGPKFQIAGYDEKGRPYSMQAAMDAGLGTNAPVSAPGGVQNLNTGPMVTGPGIVAQPGMDARTFAHQMMMPYWQSLGINPTDHAADQYGEHQNGALDLPISSIEQGNQVLQKVLADPNVYGAIFNNQAYGYGQGPGARPYSGGNTGNPDQDHTNHVHVLYKPGDPNNINPNGQPIPGISGMSPAGLGGIPSGVTPVYVVNMPGGGLGDLGSLFGGPGQQHGPGGLPGPGAPGGASLGMDRVAQSIIQEGKKRGLSPEAIKAGLAIAMQETQLGSHPNTNGVQNQNGTPGIQGVFQQDNSYKYDKTNPALAAGGFFDRLISEGGTAPGADPWQTAVTGVQRPAKPYGPGSHGYDYGAQSGEWLRNQWGDEANDYYNRLAGVPPMPAPGAPGTPPGRIWPAPLTPPPGWPFNGAPGSPMTPPGQLPPIAPYSPGAYPGTDGSSPYPGWNPAVQRDVGGTIGSGVTPVINNTGRPETIVNPQGMVGDRHVSELFPSPGPGPAGVNGMGPANTASAPAGANPEGQQYGGAEPDAAPGGGASMSGGGLWQAAVGAASMAADAFAPGSGAAVQIGAQVAQRAIKLGGQLAGVGVQGLMETFLPTGASDLANNNWLTRIGGAFTGMGPQLPNLAGKPPTPVPAQQPQDLSMFPQSVPTGPQQPSQPPVINYNLYGVGDVKDTSMNDFINNTARQASAGSVLPQGTSGMR